VAATSSIGQSESAADVTSPAVPARVRWARYIYLVVAWVFVACVVVQVFSAGSAIFVDSSRWELHTSFVRVFEPMGLLLFVAALFARFGLRHTLLTLCLPLLAGLQYLFIDLGRSSGFSAEFAALHPINALLIFVLALHVGQLAWRKTRELDPAPA
jgi:hypothetical protein